MGLLDFLSPALTTATQAVGAKQQGDIQGSQLMRAIMGQQLAMDEKRAMIGMNTARGKNFQSEIDARSQPKRHYDAVRGVMVDESAGSATPVAGLPDKPAGAQGHVVDPVTGEVKFFDPVHPPSDLRVHPQPKPDSYSPVVVDDGTGKNIVKPFSRKTGTVGPAVGEAKQTLHIESPQNTAAKARLEAAVSEMNNAHQGMDDFEQKLARGEANINGLEQIAGRAANSFTHDDPISMAAQSAALSTLNRTNPELARYIRRGLSFAEGESMISQRPSDFRTRMSAFLSQAASGASPEMIHDIQSRRHAILGPLNSTVGGSAQHSRASSGASAQATGNVDLGKPSGRQGAAQRAAPSHAQQLWDAAVAKHGEAKVVQEYGPRPQE